MERREKSAIVESLGVFKFAKSAKSFLCHWVSAANGRGRREKGERGCRFACKKRGSGRMGEKKREESTMGILIQLD
jgi:hypothetical protein